MIGDVITGLSSAFPNVVVVDDGSSADTAAVLKGLGARRQASDQSGAGRVLQTGTTFALERGAHTSSLRRRRPHRAEDALSALRMLGEGQCDVVCGSRFLGTTSNVPRVRKIILKTIVGLANGFSNDVQVLPGRRPHRLHLLPASAAARRLSAQGRHPCLRDVDAGVCDPARVIEQRGECGRRFPRCRSAVSMCRTSRCS